MANLPPQDTESASLRRHGSHADSVQPPAQRSVREKSVAATESSSRIVRGSEKPGPGKPQAHACLREAIKGPEVDSHLHSGRIFGPLLEVAAPFLSESLGPHTFVGNDRFIGLNGIHCRWTLCPTFSDGCCDPLPSRQN